MRLLEFQAKGVLEEYGISIPKGVLITSQEHLNRVSPPVVLKVQIPVGGRGKAGGIRKVEDDAAAAAIGEELLGSEIKGCPVQAILAEQPVEMERELYLAYLIDRGANLPVVMASVSGGIDIEEVARQTPDRIIKRAVDPILGVQEHEIRFLAKLLEIDTVRAFQALLQGMVKIFNDLDATLVEINPLAVTGDGLVAVDAKILLDDKAAFRHEERFASLREVQRRLDRRPKRQEERLAEEMGVTYVPLKGDIGIIADGAGTGMLTVDLVHEAGGRPADFCEMGGLSNAGTMQKTIELVLTNPQVNVLLISLIGGLTRMDEMADGILQYLNGTGRRVPMVIRMCGTKADVGKERLSKVGIETSEDLTETVHRAVAQAKGS